MAVDEYIAKVIGIGDEGSALLAAKCAPTLKNSRYVEIIEEGMNGIAVLRLPEDLHVAVHSASGDHARVDTVRHAASLVDRLVEQARAINTAPVGFANVIDAKTGDKGLISAIAEALAERANHYGIAILNGELAILGSRMDAEANVSGTMLSVAGGENPGIANAGRQRLISPERRISTGKAEFRYAVFNPDENPVYINSDGVGTKTEFHERAGKPERAFDDTAAMKLDDCAKIGATAKVISEMVETSGSHMFRNFHISCENYAKDSMKALFGNDAIAVLYYADAGNRIRGYREDAPAFNMSGSLVSVIDEARFKNPLKPSEGDAVVAIAGIPNPRSNGITDKRRIMAEMMGNDWHNTPQGRIFLEYLAQPSTILYPVFRQLIDQDIATSVYHMSGGAFNGKFARPLAKHGLFAKLENLFPPDWREYALIGCKFATPETAYGKWPMGNDGFITTREPERAISVIEGQRQQNLHARAVGRVERLADRTGVEIRTPSGHIVYFSGKN